MQNHITYANAGALPPYNPHAQDLLGQWVQQDDGDGRCWGFGLLPFVGGLL